MRNSWRFFLPDVCQLRSRHIGKFVHAFEREIIFWPFVANLPQNATGMVRILKTFKIWGFLDFLQNR